MDNNNNNMFGSGVDFFDSLKLADTPGNETTPQETEAEKAEPIKPQAPETEEPAASEAPLNEELELIKRHMAAKAAQAARSAATEGTTTIRRSVYAYKGCRDFDSFTQYVMGLGDELYPEIKAIVRDPAFYDFLNALGFKDQAAELQENAILPQTHGLGFFHSPASDEDLTLKEVEMLFDLMESRTENEEIKAALRTFYKENGPYAYLLWWKERTHLYKHTTGKARDYIDNIDKFEFTGKDISSMRESFLKLKEMSVGFRKMFGDNIFLARMGLSNGKDQIVSTHEEMYWHGELLGEPVPLGAKKSKKDVFVRQAFVDAEKHCNNLTESIDKTGKELMEKDKLYLGFNVRFLVVFIVCGVVAALALAKGYILKDLFKSLVLTKINLNCLEDYLYSLYRLFFMLLAAFGIWQLFRLKSSLKTVGMVKDLQNACSDIKALLAEEESKLDRTCQKLIAEPGKRIELNDRGYEQLTEKYTKMAKDLEEKTSLERLVFHDVLIMGLTIVCFWYLGRYSVQAMGESFNYYSVACMLITYLIFHMLLYYVEMALCDLVGGIFAKIAVLLLYIGYQVGMGMFVKMSGLFVNLQDALLGKTAENGNAFLTAISHITSRGGAIMIVTTLTGILLIVMTKAEDEIDYIKEGLYAPSKDSGTVFYEGSRVKKGNKKLFLFTALFMLLDARIVSLLVHSVSPIKVVIYLVMGGVWAILAISFFTEDNAAMYGNRYVMSFITFYVYYVFMALAGVAGFDLKVALFVILQPLPMRLLFMVIKLL